MCKKQLPPKPHLQQGADWQSDEAGVGHHGPDIFLDRHQAVQHLFGLALAGDIVLDAALHDRGAELFPAIPDLSQGVPMHAANVLVELVICLLPDQVGDVRHAQKLPARLRVNPQVHAEQSAHGELAACFQQGATQYCPFRRFVGFDMRIGLCKHDDARHAFFHCQEAFVAFDDCRYREVGRQHGCGMLDAELTELYFDFAGLPDFVKHLSVELGDGGFIGVCNSFPLFVLQTIHESRLISDAETLGVCS